MAWTSKVKMRRRSSRKQVTPRCTEAEEDSEERRRTARCSEWPLTEKSTH